jgi:hypothetical protein
MIRRATTLDHGPYKFSNYFEKALLMYKTTKVYEG